MKATVTSYENLYKNQDSGVVSAILNIELEDCSQTTGFLTISSERTSIHDVAQQLADLLDGGHVDADSKTYLRTRLKNLVGKEVRVSRNSTNGSYGVHLSGIDDTAIWDEL